MATETYQVNDTGGSAWGKWGYAQPAVWERPSALDDPGCTLTGAEEDTISTDDLNFVQRTGAGGSYVEFRCLCNTSISAASITQIKFTAKVAASIFRTGIGFSFYIGDFNGSTWDKKVDWTNNGTAQTLTSTITSNISNYIDGSGNMEMLISFLATWPGLPSQLNLKYAEIEITYTPPSLILEKVICENVILE